jgi:hypothetical protein
MLALLVFVAAYFPTNRWMIAQCKLSMVRLIADLASLLHRWRGPSRSLLQIHCYCQLIRAALAILSR